MKMLLSPSLLSANLADMAAVAGKLADAGIAWLHLDIMDGSFVPNITFGPPVLGCLRKATNQFFDVHLMIEGPERYIEDFANAGANLLAPHIEAMRHPQRTLRLIRQYGMKAGIALNPDTDPSRLRWLLPDLDMILIMGVNPGFSGQKFIPQTLEKVADCRAYLSAQGFGDMPIQVDGGVDMENAVALLDKGANILVSGSAFFKNSDYGAARRDFARRVENAALSRETAAALLIAKSWHKSH